MTIQLGLMLWFGGSQKLNRVGSRLSTLAQTNASCGIEAKQLDFCLGLLKACMLRLLHDLCTRLCRLIMVVLNKHCSLETFFRIVD